MAREVLPIELTEMHVPELGRLAQEVRRTRIPIVLRENGEDVAILSPARPPRRKGKALTPAQREAFLSSAGGWKGLVDVEEFKRDIKEARSDHRSPPRL